MYVLLLFFVRFIVWPARNCYTSHGLPQPYGDDVQAAFSARHEFCRAFTKATSLHAREVVDQAAIEMWASFNPASADTLLDVSDEYHAQKSLPRYVQAMVTLCEHSDNPASDTNGEDDSEEVRRTLAVFAALRIMQFASAGAAAAPGAIDEKLLSRALDVARRVFFKGAGDKDAGVISLDEANWQLMLSKADKLALTAGVQQYAFTIVAQLTDAVRKQLPSGANNPKRYAFWMMYVLMIFSCVSFTLAYLRLAPSDPHLCRAVPCRACARFAEAIREVATTDSMALELQALYKAQVDSLLSLPLSAPAARRHAFILRTNLRRGVEAAPAGEHWVDELFDLPNLDQERLLRLEASAQ